MSRTPSYAPTHEAVGPRRLRGGVLLVGAVLIAVAVDQRTVSRYWFPALTGVVYLLAAAVSRSRTTLWVPGAVLTAAGLTLGLWIGDGRSVSSCQLLALLLLAVGTAGVLLALLAERDVLVVTPTSLSLVTLLLGAFLLVDQQGYDLPLGRTTSYLALLGLWGLVEIVRPARR